jgi:hypothetical protein
MKHRMYVVRLGDPEWPRFAVRFGKGRFFTGKGWSHDLAGALLYHDKQEAENQAIYMDDNTPPRRFVTTALVLVDCAEPLTFEAVQELLEEATVSVILDDENDLNDMDIYITLDVKGLEEVG